MTTEQNQKTGQGQQAGQDKGEPKHTPFEWFQSIAKSSQHQKISHALLSPGVTFQQALAKSYIEDQQQLNQIVQFYTELQDSGLGEDAKPPRNQWNHLIINWLIGANSVKGLARAQAAQVDIGVFDQLTHGIRMTGKSPPMHKDEKRFGILKNNKKDEDDNRD